MKIMKIMHMADLHIRDKNIDEAEKCLTYAAERARQGVDLIIIAGDTFDSRDVKAESRAARLVAGTIADFADIAPVAIVTGTPSHDGAAPELLAYISGAHPVQVSARPDQFVVNGAYVTLVPTPTKQFFNEGDMQASNDGIARAMAGVFAGFGASAANRADDAPHILAGHWNVSGSRLPTGQTLTGQDIDISVDQMMLAQPDLICLGHIHQKQQLGDRAFYSGSLYPLNWGETTEHGFYIHTLEGRQLVSSQYFNSPCRRLIRVAEKHDIEEGLCELGYALYGFSKEELAGAYVRADITVWQDDAAKINKEEIQKFYLDSGALDADIRLIRVPRQTVRSESVLKVETLRDKLVAMAAIKGETVPESILQKADELESGQDIIGRAA